MVGHSPVKVTEKVELYNLAEDISEKHDLAAAQPDKVNELRARLNEFTKGAAEPIRMRRGGKR